MKKVTMLTMLTCMSVLLFIFCNDPRPASAPAEPTPTTSLSYGGYSTQVEWGAHLVTIGGCNDCHTPKKMTPMGPDIDSSNLFSGHLEGAPEPDFKVKDPSKGLVVTTDLTTWIGPWGTSYAANLTSDETGIGNWKEEQFIKALREGKLKGLDNTRPILPPMPWQMLRHLRDDEIKAIFAYLKSTKPIHNVVPQPKAPGT